MSRKGRQGHLLSNEWDGIWEICLEKPQHLVTCCELLKFFKGHEECAGEGLVLSAKEEGKREGQRQHLTPGGAAPCPVCRLAIAVTHLSSRCECLFTLGWFAHARGRQWEAETGSVWSASMSLKHCPHTLVSSLKLSATERWFSGSLSGLRWVGKE